MRPEQGDLRLYGRRLGRRRAVLVAVAIVLVVGAIVLLLITGGGVAEEPTGDLTYVPGSSTVQPGPRDDPIAATIADIVEADVGSDGSDYVFSAEVGASLPKRLQRAVLELRWDISADDGAQWVVSAKLDRSLNASVFSPSTNYGVGTVDGTLPGEVAASETTVTIRLDASRIDGFPSSFDWSLSAAIVAFRNDPGSPRAEDRYPDEGVIGFEA